MKHTFVRDTETTVDRVTFASELQEIIPQYCMRNYMCSMLNFS